jgi:hypothetical protein
VHCDEHVPPEQTSPAAHALPHDPQLLASSGTHDPLHESVPVAQLSTGEVEVAVP